METFNIKKILVPTDFSEQSDNALRTAVAMCKRHKASMVLLNVYEPTANVTLTEGRAGFYGETLKEIEKIRRTRLEMIARKIREVDDILVEIQVRMGNVADAVCALTDEEMTDIIVMGTHGSSGGLSEFFVGTNTYSVVKESQVPVLMVPSSGEWENFKKILFPLRKFNNSVDKYEAIRPIIEKNDSLLILLGVVEAKHPALVPETYGLLNYFKSKLEYDGVTYESQLYCGDQLAENIMNTAESYHADLIVIMASNNRKVENFLASPYSEQIVNRSRTPVLAINPKA